MSAKIIDCFDIANNIKNQALKDIKELNEKKITASLAVIQIGDDFGSKVYVRKKKKECEEVGINFIEHFYDDIQESELLKLIDKLNKDNRVNAIIVQLPLPNHIDKMKVLNAISPEKDVDCFHPYNFGNFTLGSGIISPCTSAACLEIIKSTGVDIEGKFCVIVGKSNIAGKPMAITMMKENATVCVCNTHTSGLNHIAKHGQILIVAAGHRHLIKEDMVQPGAVVVDIGINRLDDGSICGDVDFENVKNVAGYITKVPGGVGVVTVAMIIKNVVTLTKNQNNFF